MVAMKKGNPGPSGSLAIHTKWVRNLATWNYRDDDVRNRVIESNPSAKRLVGQQYAGLSGAV
jgi:hypothetical protein